MSKLVTGETETTVKSLDSYLNTGSNPLQDLVLNDKDISELRANALFKDSEYKVIDSAIVKVSDEVLNGIQDLRDNNLTNDLGGLGAIYSQYTQISNLTDAEVNLSGVTSTEEDTAEYSRVKFPVPIISKAFRINARRLKASRRMGTPFDTSQIEIVTELVADKLEEMLFRGNYTFEGNDILGYLQHGDVNTPTGASGDWGGTPTNAYDDILLMIEANEAAGALGPYTLYVSRTQLQELRQVDPEGSGDLGTIRDRVLDLDEIEQIKVTKHLNDSEVVLADLKSKYVELDVGQDITSLQWDSGDGMVSYHKILFAGVPKIKTDYEGNCGICKYESA